LNLAGICLNEILVHCVFCFIPHPFQVPVIQLAILALATTTHPDVQLMMAEAARTVAAVFISSRLDYCNSLLCSLPDTLLRKLPSVQNATARLITGTSCKVYGRPLWTYRVTYNAL